MVTIIDMWRSNLITKEAMEDMCKGEDVFSYRYSRQGSVNDDLNSLFEDLRLGKQPLEHALTYFSPKLTKEELKAIEKKMSNLFGNSQSSLQ